MHNSQFEQTLTNDNSHPIMKITYDGMLFQ